VYLSWTVSRGQPVFRWGTSNCAYIYRISWFCLLTCESEDTLIGTLCILLPQAHYRNLSTASSAKRLQLSYCTSSTSCTLPFADFVRGYQNFTYATNNDYLKVRHLHIFHPYILAYINTKIKDKPRLTLCNSDLFYLPSLWRKFNLSATILTKLSHLDLFWIAIGLSRYSLTFVNTATEK
jgi:hypothetical protein